MTSAVRSVGVRRAAPAFGFGRTTSRLLAALCSVTVLLVVTPATTADARSVVMTGASPISERRLPNGTADQGLALSRAGGRLLTRGNDSIPGPMRAAGWVHVGDPDAAPGYVVDAYQGSPGASSKAFLVSYADGHRVLLVHPLAAGESYHNSFVTISPDGRWLVSGEWGTMRRLLVFALPPPGAGASTRTIGLAATISLSHRVRDVQGCDFSSPTRLLCSTNDTTRGLFPVGRQLLSLTLRHPPRAGPDHAAVRLVGSVPQQDVCSGTIGEAEGIDVTDDTVRVAVNTRCAPITEIFTYPRDARWRPAGDIDVQTSWLGLPPPVGSRVSGRVDHRW